MFQRNLLKNSMCHFPISLSLIPDIVTEGAEKCATKHIDTILS